ncbi:hypothetical protein [Massilia sp. Dwa41.01b]|uniref:hypothetical protein n=1 Tax=Massilia sp. Dwa41.01b TaxID=2709302 RepID=UPI0028055683|nr:hypothetical protein [Massilia sp. Dwa41.01b]
MAAPSPDGHGDADGGHVAAVPGKGAYLHRDASLLVAGITLGGSSAINFATAAPPPQALFARHGIDLEPALAALRADLPLAPPARRAGRPDGGAHDGGGPRARPGVAQARQDDPARVLPRRLLALCVRLPVRRQVDGARLHH